MINFRLRELRARRAPVATPSDAARVLAAHGADQRAKRTTTTDTLRAFVAAGGVSKLGWKA